MSRQVRRSIINTLTAPIVDAKTVNTATIALLANRTIILLFSMWFVETMLHTYPEFEPRNFCQYEV
jgi:hypothetical protein